MDAIKNQLDQYEIRFEEMLNQVVKKRDFYVGKQILKEQEKKE
jgi:hypothetical protein